MKRMRFVGLRLIPFGIAAILVVGFVVSGLWNALLPGLFGLPSINFWQALGLFILGRVLIGGFGPGGGRGGPRFVRGWGDLTPDERQRFRDAMGPCGPRGAPDGGAGPA